MAVTTSNTYHVWQWNCRGFKKKKANLHQHVNNMAQQESYKPDIIALQEVNSEAGLSFYRAFHCRNNSKKVTTLVHREQVAAIHDIETSPPSGIPHVFVEIIPTRTSDPSLFVLNVYVAPQEDPNLDALFRSALKVSRDCPLLIVGDFNAGHTLWGYPGDTRKGRHLAEAAQESGLTLINDTTARTRIGNRGQVDTNPDLTFVVHSKDYAWTNTGETLGSDHCILHTEICERGRRRRKQRFSVTNWDKFRESRRTRASEGSIDNISSWTSRLLGDVEEHTEHLDPEDAPETSNVDSRLLHMWQARSSMLRRWQQQGKGNQALKESPDSTQRSPIMRPMLPGSNGTRYVIACGDGSA